MITITDPVTRRRIVANVYYELTEELHDPRLSRAEVWTVCYLAIVEATTGTRHPSYDTAAHHLLTDVLRAYEHAGHIVTTKEPEELGPTYDHAGLIETVQGLRGG